MKPAPYAPYDPLAVPTCGISLVEASAGTGKTHALTDLCLRWIVERGLPVENLLVLTYTVAATGELRDRVRRRLRRALEALAPEGGTGAVGDAVLAAALAAGIAPETVRLRLTAALHGFDRAAIHTIHAWCMRVLQDFAFESGALFETELSTDRDLLLEELARDFHRREVAPLGRAFFSYLESGAATLDPWLGLARRALALGGVRVVPDEPPGTAGERLARMQTAETDWHGVCDRWRTAWTSGAPDLLAWMRKAPELSRQRYRVTSIDRWAAALDAWFADGAAPFALDDAALLRFSREALEAGFKKGGGTIPASPLPDACAALLEARVRLETTCATLRRSLLRLFLDGAEGELAQRARAARLLFHDQLLSGVRDALHGPHGAALAARLRERFPIAMIDECQDTDAVQVQIFRAIYENAPGHALVLIGDPKQSIYQFRGADVFAYLRVAEAAGRRFTLAHNYRSDADLVHAVNRTFTRAARPFLVEGIAAAPVQPAREGRPPRLTGDPEGDAPVQVLRLDPEDGALLPKQRALPAAAAAVATEIVRLLTEARRGRLRWRADDGERALEPGDIAILVRTHREGAALRRALNARGVPSVLLGDQSVFDTAEAGSLWTVLDAIAQPADEGRLRAAWLTDLLGGDAADVAGLEHGEAAEDPRRALLWTCHEAWMQHGFSRMWQTLHDRADLLPRLAGLPDGERRLTNLRQLGELLEEAATAQRLGPVALVRWFARRRAVPRGGSDEEQLRLESDERRVPIVTIHRSKGLQYPVVFLPAAWEGRREKPGSDRPILFHDRAGDRAATVDLGSDARETHAAWALEEERAEALRLLYVAMTRAAARVILVLGRVNLYGESPAAWLLHQPFGAEPGDPPAFDTVADRTLHLDEGAFQADLQRWADDTGGRVRIRRAVATDDRAPVEPAPHPRDLAPRPVTRRLDDGRRVTSFSYLAAHPGADLDQPDVDPAVAQAPTAAVEPRGVHAFPAGARAGTFLHKVLETLDFNAAPADIAGTCGDLLARHGFPAHWRETVAGAVGRILAAPLPVPGGPLRLADIPRARRVDEMEFHMPVRRPLTPETLSEALRREGWPGAPARLPESIGRLRFGPTLGYIKGYIDLVFEANGRYYLADYKSNLLGPDRDAYRPERLTEAMVEASYTLQYLLYAVALHRHLGQRLGAAYDYETHFGGVLYLFLRGLADPPDAAPPDAPLPGLFFDRPSAPAIDALSAVFGEG